MKLIDADEITKALDEVLEDPDVRSQSSATLFVNFTKQVLSDSNEVDPFTHGHWIREEDDFGNYWICSHCNHFNYSGNPRYCSNCGSKMDEIVIENVKTYET